MRSPFIEAYLACAEWSSTVTPPGADPDSEPVELDSVETEGWHPSTYARAEADAARFAKLVAEYNAAHPSYVKGVRQPDPIDLDKYDPTQVGHDLWLTRNHHGAGFWDRPEVYEPEWDDVPERLVSRQHALWYERAESDTRTTTLARIKAKLEAMRAKRPSRILTAIAHKMGECSAYIGDDGYVYFEGGNTEPSED